MSGMDSVYNGIYAGHLKGTGLVSPNKTVDRHALLERMYINQLTELCMNRFKWEGLPESVSVRFLEVQLFSRALAVFYFDNSYDRFMALQGTPAGQYNMYQDPTAYNVYGNTFVNKRMTTNECVPIWSNYTRTPDLDVVYIYATKLAQIDLTLEINSLSARRTRVLAIPENMKLSGANYVRQIDEGAGVIAVNSNAMNGMDGALTSLDLGVDPDQIVKLHMYRTRLWGEVMGLLGIDNANQDKKERLVAAEVSANDGQTQNMRRVNLNAREQACEQINQMFPSLDVKVSYWVDDQQELAVDEESDPSGEVSVNGNFHQRAARGN